MSFFEGRFWNWLSFIVGVHENLKFKMQKVKLINKNYLPGLISIDILSVFLGRLANFPGKTGLIVI
jgi:hypothetical protein